MTGDATIVGSVLVEIANPVGRTDLPRLSVPMTPVALTIAGSDPSGGAASKPI